MDIFLNKIIIFLTENHLVSIPLLAGFSATLALLAWKQIKYGCKFYLSKQRLIAKLREKSP